MDVYFGLTSGSTVDLGAAGVGVAGVAALGELPSGNYRVLLCVSVANPAATIGGCSDNSTGTFFNDKNEHIGEDQTVELVFGATAEGVGRLSKVTIDTGCITPGGRLTLNNAADTEPVVVSLDGAEIDDSLPSGKTAKTPALAGTHTLASNDGAALNLTTPIEVLSQQNTVAYIQGNPNAYAVVAVHQVALDCATPPPTDPPASTGTNPSGVNASTTAVSPKFTG